MDNETRERIEKEAKEYCENKYPPKIAEFAVGIYLTAATAEHSRITELLKEERNKAIDECVALVGNQSTIDARTWPEVKRKLDSLKR